MQIKQRRLELGRPLDLSMTIGLLHHGKSDPCIRLERGRAWRATRTPVGPATILLQDAGSQLHARAWGAGAEWALEALPLMVGEHQNDADFRPSHPVVSELHKRFRGFRVPRTNAVFEALLPSILEQRVTGMEAKSSYMRIVRKWGEPAPGPAESGVMLQPTPSQLAKVPSWALHPLGVERQRADTIRRAASVAARLEEASDMTAVADRERRLTAVGGIGLWTTAEVALRAFGDADAVSVGDYHIPNWVSWALAREPRGDDARMLELLEPFRGQRGRIVRLITAGHPAPPKWGPRYSPIPIAQL